MPTKISHSMVRTFWKEEKDVLIEYVYMALLFLFVTFSVAFYFVDIHICRTHLKISY